MSSLMLDLHNLRCILERLSDLDLSVRALSVTGSWPPCPHLDRPYFLNLWQKSTGRPEPMLASIVRGGIENLC